jgi:hypothetical protein
MTLEYSGIERRLDELSERLGRLEPLRMRTQAEPGPTAKSDWEKRL